MYYICILKDCFEEYHATVIKNPIGYVKAIQAGNVKTKLKDPATAELCFVLQYRNKQSAMKVGRWLSKRKQQDLAYYMRQSPKQVKKWLDKIASTEIGEEDGSSIEYSNPSKLIDLN